MTPELRSLGGGLSLLQGPLWQTNAALIEAGNDVVLVDPAQFPDELALLRAAVDDLRPERLWVLITHADFDHVQGIPVFPEGKVVAEPATAEQLTDGRAAEGLRGACRDFGADWDDHLRVDRMIACGKREQLGDLDVVTIAAPGHQDNGAAFAFPSLGILSAGDYLSSITYPFCIHAIAEARATTERLLEAIEEHAITRVVPGHGPVHDTDAAKRIGKEDVRYLQALEAAAAEAKARALAPAFALLHVFAVRPPRANTDDFEMYDLRGLNARTALRAVGIDA